MHTSFLQLGSCVACVVFLPSSPNWRAEPETAAAGLALLVSLYRDAPAKTLEIKRYKTQLPKSGNFVSFCMF